MNDAVHKTMIRLMIRLAKPYVGPSIADAIRFRQEQYGLNDAQMSTILGVERSHYCEFLKGRRALPKVAIRNAYIIGVPPDSLFEYDSEGV